MLFLVHDVPVDPCGLLRASGDVKFRFFAIGDVQVVAVLCRVAFDVECVRRRYIAGSDSRLW